MVMVLVLLFFWVYCCHDFWSLLAPLTRPGPVGDPQGNGIAGIFGGEWMKVLPGARSNLHELLGRYGIQDGIDAVAGAESGWRNIAEHLM